MIEHQKRLKNKNQSHKLKIIIWICHSMIKFQESIADQSDSTNGTWMCIFQIKKYQI